MLKISPVSAKLYLIPVKTRVPLKFGNEVLTEIVCARVALTVRTSDGKQVTGWGETPLSVQWAWPGPLEYQPRFEAMVALCRQLTEAWAGFGAKGDAIDIGWRFIHEKLDEVHNSINQQFSHMIGRMPHLAALICLSPFDIALHDAYGKALGKNIYDCYSDDDLEYDLSRYLQPMEGSSISFKGKTPSDFLVANPPRKLRAWHLVGGLDPLDVSELTGSEPDDGYPVTLEQWIERDKLKCLKIKLRGNDSAWDYQRIVRVGEIAQAGGVDWLSTDYNCTVKNPEYVNDMLDKLRDQHPDIYGKVLYVEQPFAYDLEANRLDVHCVSARKPLFMDESAHNWEIVRLGRQLGWSGVALKTCKTQTGALLSLCWAKAHGMTLMVQDLTNPMLAQIPHVLLAAHAGTIMGVETNGVQFYPKASAIEEKVHTHLYSRAGGAVDLSTLGDVGFGYREEEIARQLPEPAMVAES